METNILEATYSSLIDNVEKQTGSLYSVWDVLPKEIPDPNAKNPEDRDDEVVITDADMRHLSSLLERMSSFVSDQKEAARELGLLTKRMLCFGPASHS